MRKLKDKEKILKATRDKQVVTYKGAQIRLLSDYSLEKFQARGSGQDGNIGRYALLSHTTKRMITTNLKTKQNKTKPTRATRKSN